METKTTKHLLVATGLYPPEIGGPATFVSMLEKSLPVEDFKVTTIPFSKVRKYPKIIRHVVYFFILLQKVWRSDLVFALDGVSVGLPAALVAKIARKPFFVRLGGDYAWEQGRLRFGTTASLDDFGQSNKHIAVSFLSFIQRLVCLSGRIVIVPRNYLKTIFTKWPLPQSKVQVIHSVFSAPNIEPKTSQHITAPKLISAARLVPWKGFKELLLVIKKVIVSFPNLTLTIVGDGELQEKLQRSINELSLQDNVFLVGKKSKSDLLQLLKNSDVFVLNTSYEGLSHQLLEVMALNLPIVTTSILGNLELLSDNETALLVTPNDIDAFADAITKIITDEHLRNKLAQNASDVVKRFNEDASLKSYIDLFDSI